MNYIIVDFEMNPLAKEYRTERKICRSEIIEIGAVIMKFMLGVKMTITS